MSNNSGFNLESFMTPTLAATVFAAQEGSLYLPGGIIPMENVPAGSTSLQVPVLAKASAAEVDSSASAFGADDFTSTALTDTTVTIPVSLYARRTILRDVGGVNPTSVGRQLGNSVAQTFDTAVTALFNDFTANTAIAGSGTSNSLNVNDMIDAAQTLRANEVMGQLYAILHPYQIGNILKDINTAAFAGGEKQNEAMRSGFVGMLNGIAIYQSAFVTETADTDKLWEGLVFGEDAMRIAMQKNVALEAGRRPEAVGWDLVASLHAGVGIVDQTRGIQVKSTGKIVEV
jgi:hypothetical protein